MKNLRHSLWALVASSALLGACGIANVGEPCPRGPGGDFLCAPGVCGAVPDGFIGSDDSDFDPRGGAFDGVCVECLNDLDCLKYDALDRPKCVRGIPPSEGGDGLPFCMNMTDHPSCDLPGGDALCTPGQCHPDAKVCVECLEDGDCGSGKVCDPGTPPDNLPFCRDAQ